MGWPTTNLHRRLALTCILLSPVLGSPVIGQMVDAPSSQAALSDGEDQPGSAEMTPESRRTIYRLAASLAALLLLTLFLVGVYLLTRIGRSLKRPSVGGKSTEYTDAWSNYRLSEEEIDQATYEEPDDRDDSERESDDGPD